MNDPILLCFFFLSDMLVTFMLLHEQEFDSYEDYMAKTCEKIYGFVLGNSEWSNYKIKYFLFSAKI